MSPVRCPYCQFELELKGTKPGRFRPSCPGCKNRFVLTVPSEKNKTPTTKRIRRRESSPGTAFTPRVANSKPLSMPLIRGRFAGYDVSQKLGHGKIATVYLARQISLDRHVALKVLSPELGSNPKTAARFMRQAYAAAQLRHDNLVQIHDLGVQHSRTADTLFFALEFVEGQTLAQVIEQNRQLDAETAVGYILQAARGLKFAQDHGLTHRDIKPNNLLLDDRGTVKVSDLGLVDRSIIGDVLYTPPERDDDPGALDGRGDIYSLGCTLYEMLTGQPPIPGRSATEAIAKAKQIPVALLFIVMKMMAPRPMDRYQSMADVIASLENWLGVKSGKPFAPARAHLQTLEQAVERFNDSKWNKLRSFCLPTFLILSLISIVLLALPQFGHPLIAAGMAGFVLASAVVYQILLGISRRTFLLVSLREFIFDGNLWDWLISFTVIAIGVLLLAAFDLQWVWLAFTIGATAVAATFFSTIDLSLAADRQPAIAQIHEILKQMRIAGHDESSIRQFICRHAGRRWEELYETLFGFEAKLLARQTWGQGRLGRLRPQYGKWREPLIVWLRRKITRRQQKRRRRMFTILETNALTVAGVDIKSARRQARASAARIVAKGAVIHQTSLLRNAESALPSHARAAIQFNAQVRAISPDWIHDDARPADEHDTDRHRASELRSRLDAPLEIIFGPGIRLVLAILILAAFLIWRNANAINIHPSQTNPLFDLQNSAPKISPAAPAPQSLSIPYIPTWISDGLGSWNGGLVGILLLISTICSGRTLGFFMLLAAATGLFASQISIPILEGQYWLTASLAVVFWITGLTFVRRS
jgi:eukaryotic-like serine/threonine-protein kinase